MLLIRALTAFFLLLAFVFCTTAQLLTKEVVSPASAKVNRERGLNMLEGVKDTLQAKYYDRNFHGIDLDEKYKTAIATIKNLDTNQQIFRVIAQFVLDLNDSHTIFVPPARANRVEYGFSLQMVGDKCFVVNISKDSDAEKQGLQLGDQVTAIGKYPIDRNNLWKLEYILYQLDPQGAVKLFIKNPDGSQTERLIKSAFKSMEDRRKEAWDRRKEKTENPYKCQEINSDVIACKLLTFSINKKYVDKMMGEVGVHKKMILDLRGNGGGYVRIEEYLTSRFFDREVKIATFIGRDKKQERIAKPVAEKSYHGDLIVMIDSDSASASEVFSRVIQLEKRGKIVGDVSRGAVMTSNYIQMMNVRDTEVAPTFSAFGINVTIADLIMSDGNRLENTGVIPDYPIGPSGKALAARVDAVLAYSAGLFGAKLTPEAAGQFYFLTKKPEDEDKENDTDDN